MEELLIKRFIIINHYHCPQLPTVTLTNATCQALHDRSLKEVDLSPENSLFYFILLKGLQSLLTFTRETASSAA